MSRLFRSDEAHSGDYATRTIGKIGQKGEAAAVRISAAQAPRAPTGLTATAKCGRVALNWTGSSGAVRYNVYQGMAPGAESTTPVKKVTIRTTATIFRLTSGTTYFFEVAAVNASGTSALSNEASAAPR